MIPITLLKGSDMKQRHYSVNEAQNQLPAIINQIDEESNVLLTSEGKPVAVLLSVNEYRKLTPLREGFWDKYVSFRETLETEGIEFDEQDFKELRDLSEGRSVEKII